jgi:hypothetical protein
VRPSSVDARTEIRETSDRATSGRIEFEGTAAELLASKDAYAREFLFMTLPPW